MCMVLNLDGRPNIHRLGDTSRGFLQVLLPEFTLTKKGDGVHLEIEISDDMLCINSNLGKGPVR